jgi:hypothetical protein
VTLESLSAPSGYRRSGQHKRPPVDSAESSKGYPTVFRGPSCEHRCSRLAALETACWSEHYGNALMGTELGGGCGLYVPPQGVRVKTKRPKSTGLMQRLGSVRYLANTGTEPDITIGRRRAKRRQFPYVVKSRAIALA